MFKLRKEKTTHIGPFSPSVVDWRVRLEEPMKNFGDIFGDVELYDCPNKYGLAYQVAKARVYDIPQMARNICKVINDIKEQHNEELDKAYERINELEDKIDMLIEYMNVEFVSEEVEQADDFKRRTFVRKITKDKK